MIWTNIAWLALGWSLILLGIMIVPLPLPLGLVSFTSGLAIILPRNKTARRILSWGRHKCPWAVGPVVKVLEKLETSRWLGGRRKSSTLTKEIPEQNIVSLWLTLTPQASVFIGSSYCSSGRLELSVRHLDFPPRLSENLVKQRVESDRENHK